MMSKIINSTITQKLPPQLRRQMKNVNNIKIITDEIRSTRFLTIIACHCDRFVKLQGVLKTIQFLNFPSNKIVIVNSSNVKYGNQLKTALSKINNIDYYEISNNSKLDIGKWMYYIQEQYENNFDYIIFTNDSIIIVDTIFPYFHSMVKSGSQLYGYNDSSQCKYHYQSYLFAVKADSLSILKNHYNNVYSKLTNYNAVVAHIELKLVDIFPIKDCFLKIAYLPGHKNENIFFSNDVLYEKLRRFQLFPIYKIKRLYPEDNKPNHEVMGRSFSQRGSMLPTLMPHRFNEI